MNDTDVSKQIEQMVKFIRQEADEKANEISVSAEEVSRFNQIKSNQIESICPLNSVFQYAANIWVYVAE